MLTYNMDVEERSVWLRATPNNAVLAQPFYATEAGLFYGRSHFATARTDKESYILFYTLAGAGLIEQNEQHIELPQGAALLMNCRTPQSYCTAPGYDVWEHYWVHLDGVGVKTLADSVQSQGRRNWVDTAQNAGTACPPAAFRGRKPFQPDHDQADCRLYPCTLCEAHQFGYAAGADPCQQKLVFAAFPAIYGHNTVQFFVIHPYYPRKRTAGSDRFPCRRGCPPGWL